MNTRAAGSHRARAAKRPRHALAVERGDALEHATNAHYEDARYYSATYSDRSEDVGYYLALALAHGGPVLEYGCGNGRIALPLAKAAVGVTGVDRSPTMLADLRRRLALLPPEVRRHVTVRRGDMRNVRLERRFGLVFCTFNTFLHLYTRRDIERFLARVRAHLARGGRYVMDVSVPVPEELCRDPERTYRLRPFRHPTTGEVVRYGERFDYDPLAQVLTIAMEFEPRDEPEKRWVTPMAHRQLFPQELEALLHYNGLEVVEVHGDYRTQPPERDAEMLIYHCRARG